MSRPAPGPIRVRRALLSVTDTRGLYQLASGLERLGVAMVATGGTFGALYTDGIEVAMLSSWFRPLLGGRLTTLYEELHASIAARGEAELDELAERELAALDLVVCNPRWFALAAERIDATLELAAREIDTGGVALIRAAARNHERVAIVVDPDDYPALLEELEGTGGLSPITRMRLAGKAFAATAAHDAAIASYLAGVPDRAAVTGEAAPRARLGALLAAPRRRSALAVIDDDRGGAGRFALYLDPPAALAVDDDRPTLGAARLVAGAGALPGAVVRDLDRALALIRELDEHAAVAVRGDDPVAAAELLHPFASLLHVLTGSGELGALAGASLALDAPLTPKLAARIAGSGLAAVVAPAASDDVVAAWPADGPRLLLIGGPWRDPPTGPTGRSPLAWRSLAGGLLVQEVDVAPVSCHPAMTVTARAPTDDELRDLGLAARVVRHVRAHALVVAARAGTRAIVGGQPDLRRALAVARARLDGALPAGAVAAVAARIDDPLELEALAEAGIRALVQPAASPRDQDVVAAADRHGMAMLATGLERIRR